MEGYGIAHIIEGKDEQISHKMDKNLGRTGEIMGSVCGASLWWFLFQRLSLFEPLCIKIWILRGDEENMAIFYLPLVRERRAFWMTALWKPSALMRVVLPRKGKGLFSILGKMSFGLPVTIDMISRQPEVL